MDSGKDGGRRVIGKEMWMVTGMVVGMVVGMVAGDVVGMVRGGDVDGGGDGDRRVIGKEMEMICTRIVLTCHRCTHMHCRRPCRATLARAMPMLLVWCNPQSKRAQ